MLLIGCMCVLRHKAQQQQQKKGIIVRPAEPFRFFFLIYPPYPSPSLFDSAFCYYCFGINNFAFVSSFQTFLLLM